ncbi:unnamed protein product [Rotaria sp. Silwood2]|nr:unnamed protein product [Rotaria sp. Silwood2]
MVLSFKPTLNSEERRIKTGHFIGKNGQYIRALQDKYNICMNIVNKYSSAKLRQKFLENNVNQLCLLLKTRSKPGNVPISIDEIKQILTEKWNETSECISFRRQYRFSCTRPIKSHSESRSWIEFNCDDRWRPKGRDHSHKIPTDKKKSGNQIDIAPYSRVSRLQLSKVVQKLSRVIRRQKNMAIGMTE